MSRRLDAASLALLLAGLLCGCLSRFHWHTATDQTDPVCCSVCTRRMYPKP